MRNWWRRCTQELFYSIGLQIGVVLIVTDIIFVLFAIYNQVDIHRFSSRYEQEISRYNTILELKREFVKGDELFYEYVKTGDETLLKEHRAQTDDASKALELLYRSSSGEAARYLLVSMKQSFASYQKAYDEVMELHEKNDYRYYSGLTYGQRIRKYLEGYADDLLQDIMQEEVRISDELKHRQSISMLLNAMIATSITAVILLFCFYINKNVTIPLNELADKAREMSQGNFSVQVKVGKANTNVSTTSRAFNFMAESVRRNVENEHQKIEVEKKYLEEQRKTMEYEKLLEEARFMALQTQTNPHFLFNTLNSISRTITFGRNEQAQMMLDSLALLMRYNLGDADIPVPLAQEIQITREYLKIQKIRFGERIHVEFRCDEELVSRIRIPRFTLQPLVENSIVHGIGPKSQGGWIVLDVKPVKSYARVRLWDNGMGMSKEIRKTLQKGLSGQKSKRIGVWNTYQRMVLFTGDRLSLKILSKEGRGTMVILRIPFMEEKSC